MVAQITGVTVRETVPDSVLERADEVELVDLTPDELQQRLREGKVYVPEQAGRAIERFFRKGNLIALRELALRRTAERVDAQMRGYMAEQGIRETWATGERLLVCVGPSPSAGAAGAGHAAHGRAARTPSGRGARRDPARPAAQPDQSARTSSGRWSSPSSSAGAPSR